MKAIPIQQKENPYYLCVKVTASNQERQEVKAAYEAGGEKAVEQYIEYHTRYWTFVAWNGQRFWELAFGTIENLFRQGFVIYRPLAVEEE